MEKLDIVDSDLIKQFGSLFDELLLFLLKSKKEIIVIFLVIILFYFLKEKEVIHLDKLLDLFSIKINLIPKVIHKIYIQHDGTIPTNLDENIKEAHQSWIDKNPGYQIKYWSLNDCRDYLRNNFPPIYLKTLDGLKPYAYKCDFMRYCIVYNEGGWYSDWKQVCLVDNLLDQLSELEEFICFYDNGISYTRKNKCVQNAFLGSIKNHPVLKDSMNNIIENVRIKFNGNNALDITGPCLLGKLINKYNIKPCGELNLDFYFYHKNIQIIRHKCSKCGIDQNWKNGNDYVLMWRKRDVYKQ